jgi:hypothetical protein
MPPGSGIKAESKAATIKICFQAACSVKIRRILMLANAVMDDIHGIRRFQNTQAVTQNNYRIEFVLLQKRYHIGIPPHDDC